MRPITQKSGILLAAGCGTTLLFVVVLLTGTLTLLSSQSADFLPAEETVAVLHSVDSSVVEAYIPWFPVLAQLPEQDRNGTIGIVRSQSGADILVRSANWSTTGKKSHLPLSKKIGYRDFLRTKKPREQWVYIKREALPPTKSFQEEITRTLLLQHAEQIGIGADTLVLYPVQQQHRESPLPSAPSAESILTVGTWNMKTVVQSALENAILLSQVQQRVVELLGSMVSVTYDILPLLEGRSMLEVQSVSGSLVFVLEGTHESVHLAQQLQKLHSARLSLLPKSELLEIQLDKQFRMRTLRNNPASALQSSESKDGWALQTTKEPNESDGLFTAHRGQDYILTNRRPLLDRALAESQPRLSAESQTSLLLTNTRSVGWLKKEAVQGLLDFTLLFFPQKAEVLLWLWEERGEIGIITFFSP